MVILATMRLIVINFINRRTRDQSWFPVVSDFGRYIAFVITSPVSNTTSDWGDLTLSDVGFGSVGILAWTCDYLVETFVENICVAITLTMWMATGLFIGILKDKNSNEWKTIYGRYRLLCRLSELINSNFAPLMGVYLVHSTFYLMSTLDEALLLRPTGYCATTLISQIVIVVTLALAANISSNMNEIKIWLMNNRESIPESDYSAVSNELQWNMIGVRGGRNMFMITYSVLWNVS